MKTEDPLDNVKKATAILVTCLVDALDEEAKARFIANLDRSYAKIRNDANDQNALELISWTRTMITGFDVASGQQRPFLKE
ncbi:hypothetical protein HAP47_0020960 [Bradyrhizobium sp. 41S5]|uniref:hypothetical protein n=1 Tax=Bradyrhizobium sp. 41S5 TaxID=1404443 RepID=UPI0015963C6E|nr:hypothetical protein [Bradyrhizobium sp. 41S5]UFX41776.1 hypothetical protein HAP47_0020960 [Bradyrhizobium sp. 41S5]